MCVGARTWLESPDAPPPFPRPQHRAKLACVPPGCPPSPPALAGPFPHPRPRLRPMLQRRPWRPAPDADSSPEGGSSTHRAAVRQLMMRTLCQALDESRVEQAAAQARLQRLCRRFPQAVGRLKTVLVAVSILKEEQKLVHWLCKAGGWGRGRGLGGEVGGGVHGRGRGCVQCCACFECQHPTLSAHCIALH
jgi:hypothetical protein